MYMNAELFMTSCARAVSAPQRAHEIGVGHRQLRASPRRRGVKESEAVRGAAVRRSLMRFSRRTRKRAGYGFPLNPKHSAAALRLSQNRPRPAPISILSALP
jgi:hypothetical protein